MPFLATVATVAAIAGTAVSALSSIKAGQAQSQAYSAQADAARHNQMVGYVNAAAVRQAGAYQEELQREKNQRLQGTLQANIGASGVTMEGTPLDVMEQNTYNMERDILASRYNTGIEAARYESQAGQSGILAGQYDAMAPTATTMGYIGAGTTLLGNAYKLLGPQEYITSVASGRVG